MNVRSQQDKDKRFCGKCGSRKTYVRTDGTEMWLRAGQIWLCQPCYHKERSSARYQFKGKFFRVHWLTRRFICSQCGKTLEKTRKNPSTWHHSLGYFPIFTWLGLLELCNTCHSKTDLKIREIESPVRDPVTGRFLPRP